MAKKLPKKIYVIWNEDSDEPFLQADIEPEMLADMNRIVPVGIYELKQNASVVTKVSIE